MKGQEVEVRGCDLGNLGCQTEKELVGYMSGQI